MLLPLWPPVLFLTDVSHHLALSPDSTHLADLHNKADQFLTQGLAPSTITTYAAGKKKYTQFCTTSGLCPMPSSETTLILFASYLATGNIAHTTIKMYLSAVRHMHAIAGLHDLFSE